MVLKKTPVVILAYARPDLLKKVLKNCPLDREYLMVCDGPKNKFDFANNLSCKKIMINFPAKKRLLFRNKNLGGPIGIPQALDRAASIYENFITLEDDVLVSPSFFYWVDANIEALKSKKIGIISACNFVTAFNLRFYEAPMLTKFTHCWGWAINSDTWNLTRKINLKNLEKYNLIKVFGGEKIALIYWNKIRKQQVYNDYWNWDYQLCFALWFLDRVNIAPPLNLSSNLGVGQFAQHHKIQTNINFLEVRDLDVNKPNSKIDVNQKYNWVEHDSLSFNITADLNSITKIKFYLYAFVIITCNFFLRTIKT